MPNENNCRYITLSRLICFILLCLTSAYSQENQRVMVESFSIKEQVAYFDYGGKSYITIIGTEGSHKNGS